MADNKPPLKRGDTCPVDGSVLRKVEHVSLKNGGELFACERCAYQTRFPVEKAK